MIDLEAQIIQTKEKYEQLKRLKKEQEIREKKKKEAFNVRRQIIIGEIVSEYFPEVLCFQPCRTNAENKTEFAPLTNFLSLLADDIQYVSQLKEKANNKSRLENQQDK